MTKETDLKKIKKADGTEYSIRIDRRRFFYPDEWKLFIKAVKKNRRPLFEFMLNTGARFDEAIHIRPQDFDFQKKNVRLWKTKTKSKKGESFGKPRTITLSSEFTDKMRRFCRGKKDDRFIFDKNYAVNNFNSLLKNTLRKIGIKDYYNFSSHNIRKTHGMYLKALGIDIAEICTRLGHDYNTYIEHYGSPELFNELHISLIKELLDDLYLRSRRF